MDIKKDINRTIKFRAWNIDTEEMTLWPFDWSAYPDGVIEVGGYTVGDDLGEDGEDSVILMQYTGLKDKNGKDVYEGDIVECEMYEELQIKTAVEFYEGAFRIRNRVGNWEYLGGYSPRQIKVIGNIYENPELLK